MGEVVGPSTSFLSRFSANCPKRLAQPHWLAILYFGCKTLECGCLRVLILFGLLRASHEGTCPQKTCPLHPGRRPPTQDFNFFSAHAGTVWDWHRCDRHTSLFFI